MIMSLNNCFCPKCGETKGEFINGFCKKCYLQDHKILPLQKTIELARCRKCGKIRVKGKWLEETSENLAKLLESNLKIQGISEPLVSTEIVQGPGKTIGFAQIIGKICNDDVELEASAELKPKEIVCNDCNLLDANYYEAVLQLRFEKKMTPQQFQPILQEIESLSQRLHKKDSLSRITGIEKITNGFNVQLGSKRAAKKIVEHFERKHNARVKSSFTLAGVDASGKEKKRFTFLMRI